MEYRMIVERLMEYRKASKLVQAQMAEYVRLSQSQYSKIEKGVSKLSFDGAKRLYDIGWDMDMIITGEVSGTLTESMRKVLIEERGGSLRRMLEQCGELMTAWTQEKPGKAELGYKLLQNYLSEESPMLPLRRLRTIWGESQENMAELIGVDLKKYRLLEKGTVNPDAELLARIYELTNCKPSFFFDEEAYYLAVVSEEAQATPDREKQLKNILEEEKAN